MTVVSIRCSECDEVKPKTEIDILGAGENICTACKAPEKVHEVKQVEEDAGATDEDEDEQSREESREESRESETEAETKSARSW